MGNILKFPEKPQQPSKVNQWGPADDYLQKCKFELCEDDYNDILEAIHDYKTYESLDKEMKILIDVYFNLLNPDSDPPKTYA